MKRVGITGGIGSGKTTVCRLLASLSGAPVYDCDSRAKELMVTDNAVVKDIINLFGTEAYRLGKLNRSYISQKIFNNADLIGRMNAIVHPRVVEDFRKWCGKQSAPYVILESALLFSSPLLGMEIDVTVAVDAPDEVRISRCMLRDGLSREQIADRIANQMSTSEMLARADRVILNDGNEPLLGQIAALDSYIKSLP